MDADFGGLSKEVGCGGHCLVALSAPLGAALLHTVLWLALTTTDWLFLSGSLIARPQSAFSTPHQQAGS